MKKALFVLTAVIFSLSFVKAQKVKIDTKTAGWSKIGETTVDFTKDKDVIIVAGSTNYKSLQIRATDAPVHVDNIQIIYQTDESENIPIRFDFKPGTESRAIDLKGNKKFVKQINLTYHTVQNVKEDKAHVEIWGVK